MSLWKTSFPVEMIIMYLGGEKPTVDRVLSDFIQECVNASEFEVEGNWESFLG
jgi:hypothetical protein